jgi:hypothetical protein
VRNDLCRLTLRLNVPQRVQENVLPFKIHLDRFDGRVLLEEIFDELTIAADITTDTSREQSEENSAKRSEDKRRRRDNKGTRERPVWELFVVYTAWNHSKRFVIQ